MKMNEKNRCILTFIYTRGSEGSLPLSKKTFGAYGGIHFFPNRD